MAPRKDITPSKKKDKYRIRNWKEYNQSLVNRGSITFWFSEDVIAKWYSVERTGKRGRPDTYSDSAIRCGLIQSCISHSTARFTGIRQVTYRGPRVRHRMPSLLSVLSSG